MAQGWQRDYTRYKSFFLNILDVYNSKPSLRIYLELMLSMGTIIVFSMFAIRPTILTIIDIQSDISSKEQTIQKLSQKLKNLSVVGETLQTESEDLFLINEAIPNSAELNSVIVKIEKLANEKSVIFKSLNTSDLSIKGNIEVAKKSIEIQALPDNANGLPLTFSITGEYESLFSFLESLENSKRPLKIDSFIINSTKSLENTIITLTISGRFPYLNLNTNEKK